MRLSYYKNLLAKLRSAQSRPEWFEFGRENLKVYLSQRPSVREAIVKRPLVAEGSLSFIKVLRFKPMPIALGALIIALLSGTGVAAQQSLPNQWLYPVKLAVEQVQLVLTPSVTGKSKAHLKFASRRLEEVEQLTTQKPEASEAVAKTLVRYENEVKQVTVALPAVAGAYDLAQVELVSDIRESLNKHQAVLTKVSAELAVTSTIIGGGGGLEAAKAKVKEVALRALKSSSELELKITEGVASAVAPVGSGGAFLSRDMSLPGDTARAEVVVVSGGTRGEQLKLRINKLIDYNRYPGATNQIFGQSDVVETYLSGVTVQGTASVSQSSTGQSLEPSTPTTSGELKAGTRAVPAVPQRVDDILPTLPPSPEQARTGESYFAWLQYCSGEVGGVTCTYPGWSAYLQTPIPKLMVQPRVIGLSLKISRVEVEKKIGLVRDKLTNLGLVLNEKDYSDEIEEEVAKLLARAVEILALARQQLAKEENEQSGNYIEAYRHALKAYQFTLEAELLLTGVGLKVLPLPVGPEVRPSGTITPGLE